MLGTEGESLERANDGKSVTYCKTKYVNSIFITMQSFFFQKTLARDEECRIQHGLGALQLVEMY